MSYAVAAVVALLAALLELTLVPYLAFGGAHPHPVLVATVIVTSAFGLDRGSAVAVAGGLALDVLAPRPLGSSVFVLLVVAGGVSALARAFASIRVVAPIVLTMLGSPVFSLALMALLSIAEGRSWGDDPIALVVPGAIYDAVLATLIGPLVVSLRARARESERLEW